jgi:ADP-dependent NAD(P)H-hydrate dehydratase / NAD(P)H-hydrate epimerase
MLTADDVRVLDHNSAWHGVPPSLLMQNAGRAVAEETTRAFKPKRVLVLAGLGNNGGDGAVAARHLADAGATVTVLYAGDPDRVQTGEARLARDTLDRRRIRVEAYRSATRLRHLLRESDVVVDALLGIGVAGDLREPIRTIVRLANASRRPVVSVDVPTGLGGRQAVRPRVTVTLHDRKVGMRPSNSGRVRVRAIGIPDAAAREVGPGDLAVHYPRPLPESHKGENGRLLAVLGGPYTGAPLLGSLAALRTGCDIVRLYAPREAARAAQAHSPDLIVEPGREDRRLVVDDVDALEPLLERSGAVLTGSGLGTDRATQAAIERLLQLTQRRRLPIVLDADALVVAGRRPELLRGRPVLCTPHAGEYRRLAGEAAPKGDGAETKVAAAARGLRATILLKAPTAIVTDGERTRLARVHPRGLTPGGVGDVLAGAAAGLMAKGLEPFRSAAAASFLVGAAARRACDRQGWGARATDILAEVGPVLRDWVPMHSG